MIEYEKLGGTKEEILKFNKELSMRRMTPEIIEILNKEYTVVMEGDSITISRVNKSISLSLDKLDELNLDTTAFLLIILVGNIRRIFPLKPELLKLEVKLVKQFGKLAEGYKVSNNDLLEIEEAFTNTPDITKALTLKPATLLIVLDNVLTSKLTDSTLNIYVNKNVLKDREMVLPLMFNFQFNQINTLDKDDTIEYLDKLLSDIRLIIPLDLNALKLEFLLGNHYSNLRLEERIKQND